MKIQLMMTESIFDCKAEITDCKGKHAYCIPAISGSETASSSIVAEVFSSDFTLSLTPITSDVSPVIRDIQVNNLKDKLAKKAVNYLLKSVNKMILRVGCDYKIEGIQESDRLDINLQCYAFGLFDKFDLLGLVPVCYAFYEVSNFNSFFKLTNACETNRQDILKYARSLSLLQILELGFLTLITYPIQVNRVKRLTKNKKVFKILAKFNSLSGGERQKFLEKQDRLIERY